MTFHVINCIKTCHREQVNKFSVFFTCKLPCGQFLLNFILNFFEGWQTGKEPENLKSIFSKQFFVFHNFFLLWSQAFLFNQKLSPASTLLNLFEFASVRIDGSIMVLNRLIFVVYYFGMHHS